MASETTKFYSGLAMRFACQQCHGLANIIFVHSLRVSGRGGKRSQLSSRGTDKLTGTISSPITTDPSPDIATLRRNLKKLMDSTDSEGRRCGSSKWGVYAFFDFDGEPIYVGQTKERLSGRIGRHLTNQRSDAVAMRILDPLEVGEIAVWPMWHLQGVSAKDKAAIAELDCLEYSVWYEAIKKSQFGAILNEKRPPSDRLLDELPDPIRGTLYSGKELAERQNPDVRVARRAETLSRLADVVRERGIVTAGLRRTLALQAIRVAYLAAVRSALADGRDIPLPATIDSIALVGSQLDLAVASDVDSEDE